MLVVLLLNTVDFENNGTIDDSTANPSHIYPTAGTQQTRLMAISNNSCVNQNLNPVVVHYNPTANFLYHLIACLQAHILQAWQRVAMVQLHLMWDFNGDNLIDNNQQNPQYIYLQSGNYGEKLEVQTIWLY
ncbi:MAG: hypothetical protein IPL10_02280 [Bacteroidetes bacterium]|nr:hypothetical protein [Bacteroidota bacterium]